MAVSPIDDPALRSQFAAGPVSEIFTHTATLQRYLDVEAALARAQASVGVIPAEAAIAITEAAMLDRIDLDRYAADVAVKNFPISPLVDQLTELVPDGYGQWAHWGATTQDIMDTARVLQTRDALDVVDARLRSISATLRALADTHRATVMAGRTQLQHAVPITFGYKAAVWAAMVDRQISHMPPLREEVLVVQLGGAAGTLSALGASGTEIRARFAAQLGLGDPGITWHTARDRVARTVHHLALVCGCLAKIGLDVALMAQTDVAELSESLTTGGGGSSTMPHKRNPVRSQILMTAARATRQLAGSALEAVVNDHERGTGVWQTEWWSMPEAFALCGGALEHGAALVQSIDVDADRMVANLGATDGRLMSEAVMMLLAPRMGRLAAHSLLESLTAACVADGVDFEGALMASREILDHATPEEIRSALDPSHYLGSIEEMIDFVTGGSAD